MASVNKVILLGNLGRDPELRYSPSGSALCNLAMATSRSWKYKDTGERREETEWHRVVLHGRLAEIAGEYLRKGRPVYIEGRLQTRKWQDREGNDRYTTEIVGESMQLLGGRDDAPQPQEAPASQQAAAPRQSRVPAPAPAPAESADDGLLDDLDPDSIPF